MSDSGKIRTRAAERHLPSIAIVGRPNVGKSALFNRILRRRHAIVHAESGVTRDRIAAVAEHDGKRFLLVDTGGLGLFGDQDKGPSDWDTLIREQLMAALESSDRVILVTDVTDGIMPLDKEVANLLRQTDKTVVVAANKADNHNLSLGAAAFSELGLGTVQPISCVQRLGLDSLLDMITDDLPESPSKDSIETPLRIAVVGRPNVGKSSVINKLLGGQRVLVSDVAGTTRDAIDVPIKIEMDGESLAAELIDTAGLRKRGKVSTAVEHFSMSRTEDAIKRAEIVLLVLDATNPGTAQDRRICRMARDAGRACILLLNKWDLAGEDVKQKDLLAKVRRILPFMNYAETIACCAVSGYNLTKVLEEIFHLRELRDLEFPTALVNRVIEDATMRLPPPRTSQGAFKIYYGVATNNFPPTFLLFVNRKEGCPENYLQYLRHHFARSFGIQGVPVEVHLKNRRREDGRPRRQTRSKDRHRTKNTRGGRSPKGRPSKGQPKRSKGSKRKKPRK